MADRNKVEKELKSIFTRKWKEQEQKEECRKKKIKDLADEAVFCIVSEMKKTANSLSKGDKRLDKVTIKVDNAFFVSAKSRNLYSRFCYTMKNPNTEKFCFSSSLTLKTQEEESFFIQAVMAKLPDAATYAVNCVDDNSFFAGNHYSFEITLNFEM